MAGKQCFLVCPPLGNVAGKQCFLESIVQSWVSANPGLKFNSQFQFVYLNASLSFKTLLKKTSIDPGKIYGKIFSSSYIRSWKICFEF